MFHKEKKSFEIKKFHNEASSFRAKKSLGQNFLKSEPALKKMCEAGEISNTDIVLEIGPGKGALTTKLLLVSQKVLAVEKDRDLFEFLKEKYSNEIKSGKLELINEDILEIDLKVREYVRNNYDNQ